MSRKKLTLGPKGHKILLLLLAFGGFAANLEICWMLAPEVNQPTAVSIAAAVGIILGLGVVLSSSQLGLEALRLEKIVDYLILSLMLAVHLPMLFLASWQSSVWPLVLIAIAATLGTGALFLFLIQIRYLLRHHQLLASDMLLDELRPG